MNYRLKRENGGRLMRGKITHLDKERLADVIFGEGGHPAVHLVPAAVVRGFRPVHLHHSRCLCLCGGIHI